MIFLIFFCFFSKSENFKNKRIFCKNFSEISPPILIKIHCFYLIKHGTNFIERSLQTFNKLEVCVCINVIINRMITEMIY